MALYFRQRCASCKGFISKSKCDMRCAVKGQEKIHPSTYSMRDIQECIQNNIGVIISQSSICKYAKLISNLINKGVKNTDL